MLIINAFWLKKCVWLLLILLLYYLERHKNCSKIHISIISSSLYFLCANWRMNLSFFLDSTFLTNLNPGSWVFKYSWLHFPGGSCMCSGLKNTCLICAFWCLWSEYSSADCTAFTSIITYFLPEVLKKTLVYNLFSYHSDISLCIKLALRVRQLASQCF